MKRTVRCIYILSVSLLFVACSDDGSSAGDQEGKRDNVSSLYELGKCSSANSGEKVFVEGEDSYYECMDVCSGYTARVAEGLGSDRDGCYDWVSESSDGDSESRTPGANSSSSVIDQTTHYSSGAESAYGNEEEAFLYKEFFVDIELTLFNQLTDNWENEKKHKDDYSDGDPWISFVIKTYSDDELKDSLETDVYKLDENIGKWTGSKHFKQNFSGGANKVYICPVVYEHNSVQKDVLKSSNYCYFINDAGNKVNTSIKQNDSESADCELEWTVTISYK